MGFLMLALQDGKPSLLEGLKEAMMPALVIGVQHDVPRSDRWKAVSRSSERGRPSMCGLFFLQGVFLVDFEGFGILRPGTKKKEARRTVPSQKIRGPCCCRRYCFPFGSRRRLPTRCERTCQRFLGREGW